MVNSGLCRGLMPFVAIDAAQLVHPLDAADQQPLQVQLQGDPQEQVDVERVVVRRERPGGRPAGDGVQRRALRPRRSPRRPACCGSTARSCVRRRNRSQHAFGVDQVEIPHPLPQFGIGQALVLVRRRLDRLGEEVQLLGEDRQLAGLGAPQLAVDADDVAQVEALGQCPVRSPTCFLPMNTWIWPVQSRMSMKMQLALVARQARCARPRGPAGRPSRPRLARRARAETRRVSSSVSSDGSVMFAPSALR